MDLVPFIFRDENGQEFPMQVVGTSDSPWFCGKDVATALGYRDTDYAIRTHVKEKHKKCLKDILKYTPEKSSGHTNYSSNELNKIFVNEAGLYSLIFASKKDKAEIFKDWVTEEMLPSIRKTGKYSLIDSSSLIEQDSSKNEGLPLGENDQILLQIRATIDSFSSFVSIEGLKDKSVIYIGYIGLYQINGEWVHCFKFGRSSSPDGRIKNHHSTFNTFELIYMKECRNNLYIENDIKTVLRNLRINTELEISSKNYTEIFYINGWAQLQDILRQIDCSIILQHRDEDEIKIKLLGKDLENKDKTIEYKDKTIENETLKYKLLDSENKFSAYKQNQEIESLKKRAEEQDIRICELEKCSEESKKENTRLSESIEELKKENARLSGIIEEYKEKFARGQVINNINISNQLASPPVPVLEQKPVNSLESVQQDSKKEVSPFTPIPTNVLYERLKFFRYKIGQAELCGTFKLLKKLKPDEIEISKDLAIDQWRSIIIDYYNKQIDSLMNILNANYILCFSGDYTKRDMISIIKDLGGKAKPTYNNDILYGMLADLYKIKQEELLARVEHMTESEIKTISTSYCETENSDRHMLHRRIKGEIERIISLKSCRSS